MFGADCDSFLGSLQSFFQFDNAADRAAKNDANIISNSWGGGNGQYTGDSEIADKLVRGEFKDSTDNPQYMNVVIAAGNDNSGISAPGTAKNAITVGAAKDGNFPLPLTWQTCSDNDWPQGQTACFTNFGPLDIDNDGNQRIKPDVIAPGVRITSTTPWYSYELYNPQKDRGYYYGTMDGTSMATPVVSGAIATLLQAYPSVKDWPEMVKARVINTAISGGNSQAKEGNGMIDSYHMIYSDSTFQNLLWIGDSLNISNTLKTYYFDVPSGFKEVKVTLTWSDPAGASEVINDLDLHIFDSNGNLVGSSTSCDDTVEQVTITSNNGNLVGSSTSCDDTAGQVITTSGTSGRWKVTVSGSSLNNAPQNFGLSAGAIIVNPSLNLIASSDKIYIGRNDAFKITTELSNNGYTALGSYVSVEIPNGISLDSVDFYRADGTKLNYPLSEIWSCVSITEN